MTAVHQEKKTMRVFISFAVSDRKNAALIRELLTYRFGARVFSLDDLSAGGDWMAQLKDEITQCDVFLVLWSWSPPTVASNLTLHSVGAAWALGKPIVVLVTQTAGPKSVLPSLPPELRDAHIIDADSLLHSVATQQEFADLLEKAMRD